MSGFTSNRGGCKLYAIDAALSAHLRPRNGAAGGAVSAQSAPVLHSQDQFRLAAPARRGQPPRKEQLCRRSEALMGCLEMPTNEPDATTGRLSGMKVRRRGRKPVFLKPYFWPAYFICCLSIIKISCI